MALNIAKELAVLQKMTVKPLQARYAEVFGEATRSHHKAWLIKRIAWRLQALAEGDLSERARRKAAELANDADLRLSPPRTKALAPAAATSHTAPFKPSENPRLPLPGTVITRPYKGQTLQVKVLAHGFEFEGQSYKSLSAVAKAITGQHCNGYHFFRLTKENA